MSFARLLDTIALEVQNPLYAINTGYNTTTSNNSDIGYIASYYNGTNSVYTGLYRDAISGRYKLFDSLQTTPNITIGKVDSSGIGYSLAALDLLSLNLSGDLVVTGNCIINGTTTTINSTTLTVNDNFVVANAGPTNQLQDGGYLVARSPSYISSTDAPIYSGIASADGTKTTVNLVADSVGSAAVNYYEGWIIKLGGDLSGSYKVLSSTATNPPVLTFSPSAAAITTKSTTYQLYNKQYVGWINDESTGYISFYGFPRQKSQAVISTTDTSGNIASYLNLHVNDLLSEGNLTVKGVIEGPVKVDDNIISVNTGPVNQTNDHGFVGQRSPISVATDDVAYYSGIPINVNYKANDLKIVITNSYGTNGYYVGWVVTYNNNISSATYIIADEYSSGIHTLTLASPFTVNLSSGTDTLNFFNKRFVGTMWDEGSQCMQLVGFPRETGESTINVASPVNGNIPTYLNLNVNNLSINGTLRQTYKYATMTQVETATLTAYQIFNYTIIYFNPTADTTFTLPPISSLALTSDTSTMTLFENISSFKSVIVPSGADTIEGLNNIKLKSQYEKVVLIASDKTPGVWSIKG